MHNLVHTLFTKLKIFTLWSFREKVCYSMLFTLFILGSIRKCINNTWYFRTHVWRMLDMRPLCIHFPAPFHLGQKACMGSSVTLSFWLGTASQDTAK